MSVASTISRAVAEAMMIAAFVSVMMVSIEYLSVITQGAFQRELARSRWRQYVAAAVLGALPGCLGPFTVVALYTHRVVSFGALVTTMIATSGDEAWVMLALFPREALGLMIILGLVGIVAGLASDILLPGSPEANERCADLVVHQAPSCRCYPGKAIVEHWRRPQLVRCVVTGAVIMYTVTVVLGLAGLSQWNWIRISLLVSGLFGLFVVVTVPDHFLHEHIWLHVFRRHLPRIAGWTVAALLVVSFLEQVVHLEAFVHQNPWAVLGGAAAVGVIPESGPHLVFVTMFDEGTIPASILVASSIVQDGHGMLPLLAESRTEFLKVKVVNLFVGVGIGGALLILGT